MLRRVDNRRPRFIDVVLGVFFALYVGVPLSAQAASTVVVYPETTGPVTAVFTEILRGIEDRSDEPPVRFRISDRTTPQSLLAFLDRENPNAVITLGRSAHDLYQQNRGSHPRPTVGALDATPDTHPNTRGIGLGVDPDLLFARLRRVNPSITRVLVVYDPHRDGATMSIAMSAAEKHGLMLRTFAATDLMQSSAHFTNFLNYGNPATDAIWLTIDANLINETANLPQIITESWRRRMVVFSNNLAHADKGVLFAMYPDPFALGQRLYGLSQEDGRADRKIRPLRDVKSALNKRMADHLDLKMTATTRSQFDLLLEGR